jgi:hypothetical protein
MDEKLVTPIVGVLGFFQGLGRPEEIVEEGLPLSFPRIVTKPSSAGVFTGHNGIL